MSQAGADRNLLLGILALQMDFISRDDLIAAMSACLWFAAGGAEAWLHAAPGAKAGAAAKIFR